MTALLDVLRFDMAVGPANLIANHSGVTNSAGWTGQSTDAIGVLSGQSYGEAGHVLAVTFSAMGGVYFSSAACPVTPGKYVSGSILARVKTPTSGASTFGGQVGVRFLNSSGTNLGVTFVPGAVTFPSTDTTSTRYIGGLDGVLVPAGAATAQLVIALTSSTLASKVLAFWHAELAQGDTAAQVTALPWRDTGVGDVNILGSGLELRIQRGNSRTGVTDDFEPGTMSALLRDSTLTPALAPYLRPKNVVRARVLVGGVWRQLATMSIDKGSVAYTGRKAAPNTDVTVVATDAISTLANTPRPQQYSGNMAQRVAQIVGTSGVKTRVVDTDPTGTSVAITNGESIMALEQLTRARDTNHGYAYVDADNVVQVVAGNSSLTSTTALTFTDSQAAINASPSTVHGYTDIDVDYSTDQLVNALTVTRVNAAEVDGTKDYGPYVASDSVGQWDPVADTLVINEGNPADHAAYFLPRATQPDSIARSVTLTVDPSSSSDLTAATLELYSRITIVASFAGVNGAYRIIGVEHTITATRWTVTYTVRPLESSSTVEVIVPSTGANTGPDDLNTVTPGSLAARSRGSALAIANNTLTSVAFDTQVTADTITYDGTNRWFVAPVAGRYLVNAAVTFDGNATGYRSVRITVNAAVTRLVNVAAPAATILPTVSATQVLKLAAGDKVAIAVLHTAGVSLNVLGNAGATGAEVVFLGL